MAGRGRQAGAASWQQLAAAQAGVVTRTQLLTLGLTAAAIDAQLRAGRWVRLHPGVFVTFTGPVPDRARVWAAALAVGDETAVGGRTALWLWGVIEAPETVVTICIPARRRAVAPPGVLVLRRRRLDELVHPAASPPRLRLEEALLDVTDGSTGEGEVVDLVLRVISSRKTTAVRVRQALDHRRQHRHRALLSDLLAEAAEGVHSALERRYRNGVERAHGLPRGERNAVDRTLGRTGAPRTRYRDVRYRRWRVVVELDGGEAHPVWQLRRDRARDNSATTSGDRVLVYGWFETVAEPCQVAVEVTRLLWQQGWRGVPHPCPDPACPITGLIPP